MRPLGAIQTDGRTDRHMTKLKVGFHNFANAVPLVNNKKGKGHSSTGHEGPEE